MTDAHNVDGPVAKAVGKVSEAQNSDVPAGAEKEFHGWRLLGYLGIVILALVIVSAVVDWLVLGPLIGRVF